MGSLKDDQNINNSIFQKKKKICIRDICGSNANKKLQKSVQIGFKLGAKGEGALPLTLKMLELRVTVGPSRGWLGRGSVGLSSSCRSRSRSRPGRKASKRASVRSSDGPHLLNPASFCNQTITVPWAARMFNSGLVEQNRQSQVN